MSVRLTDVVNVVVRSEAAQSVEVVVYVPWLDLGAHHHVCGVTHGMDGRSGVVVVVDEAKVRAHPPNKILLQGTDEKLY